MARVEVAARGVACGPCAAAEPPTGRAKAGIPRGPAAIAALVAAAGDTPA
jgi:hypothetical protein